ncbi:hypothetical protein EXE43_18130 [Halorubrum sp. SS5]|nr:hypothetical protein EXE43_18130 [Halorubrum sp. SS5]
MPITGIFAGMAMLLFIASWPAIVLSMILAGPGGWAILGAILYGLRTGYEPEERDDDFIIDPITTLWVKMIKKLLGSIESAGDALMSIDLSITKTRSKDAESTNNSKDEE